MTNGNTPQGSDSRDGSSQANRPHEATIQVGPFTLEVPRDRDGTFQMERFARYRRAEKALVLALMEMVLQGVASERVKGLVIDLCGRRFGRETVEDIKTALDRQVRAWTNRPLDTYYPVLVFDQKDLRTRRRNSVRPARATFAAGVNADGHREILGVHVAVEDANWNALLEDLGDRGLETVGLVVSEAHPSLREALRRAYPTSAWQRCQSGFRTAVLEQTPVPQASELDEVLDDILASPSQEAAHESVKEGRASWARAAPDAWEVVEDGWKDATTALSLPRPWNELRTTEMLRPLVHEIQEWEAVVRIFPYRRSAWRLLGALFAEWHEEWSTGPPYVTPVPSDADGAFGAVREQSEAGPEEGERTPASKRDPEAPPSAGTKSEEETSSSQNHSSSMPTEQDPTLEDVVAAEPPRSGSSRTPAVLGSVPALKREAAVHWTDLSPRSAEADSMGAPGETTRLSKGMPMPAGASPPTPSSFSAGLRRRNDASGSPSTREREVAETPPASPDDAPVGPPPSDPQGPETVRVESDLTTYFAVPPRVASPPDPEDLPTFRPDESEEKEGGDASPPDSPPSEQETPDAPSGPPSTSEGGSSTIDPSTPEEFVVKLSARGVPISSGTGGAPPSPRSDDLSEPNSSSSPPEDVMTPPNPGAGSDGQPLPTVRAPTEIEDVSTVRDTLLPVRLPDQTGWEGVPADRLKERLAQEVTAFLIAGTEVEVRELLVQIRSNRQMDVYLKPIIWLRNRTEETASDSLLASAVDEVWTPRTDLSSDAPIDPDALPEDMRDRIDAVNHRITRIREAGNEREGSVGLRVLRYMTTRDLPFRPVRTSARKEGFVYPPLDPLLAGSGRAIIPVLSSLEQRHRLAGEFVTKRHACMNCRSGFLNFVEICPNCGSANLEVDELIHHFRCAHTGPKWEFEEGNEPLVCPKCERTLHQIGTDYDKPSLVYSCHQCNHQFQNPDVRTDCYHCGYSAPPERQIEERIKAYEVTESGQQTALHGSGTSFLADLRQTTKVLDYSSFKVVLSTEKRRGRQQGSESSLLVVRLAGIYELQSEYAQDSSQTIIEEIARIFDEIADESNYLGVHHSLFFFLLTNTDLDGADDEALRIQESVDDAMDDRLNTPLELQMDAWPVNEDLELDAVIEEFLSTRI